MSDPQAAMAGHRSSGAERGASMAEFAIAVTVLLTLILGIIDYGRALYTYHLVTDAARYGTRYAMVRGANCTVSGCPATNSSVQTYVRGVSPGIDQTQLTVTTTYPGGGSCTAGSATPGCKVQVVATYPFKFIVVPLLPNATMTMTSTSQMVISQ